MAGPALIDFEASCLPEDGQSYPIEVAVARLDGTSQSWLIRPSGDWQFWDWSDEAEALHGIDRDTLDREGTPAKVVLDQLVAFVGDYDIYADADLDAYWLETLAAACRVPPPFPIRFLGEYLVEQGYSREQVVAALDEARRRLPKEHFARDDASRLALTVRLLRDGEAG